MAFQKSVRRFQAFGIEGELYGDKHTFTYATTLLANGSVNPSFGKAFTYASNPAASASIPEVLTPSAAQIGGTGGFAGILVYPKEHVLRGGLTPSMEVAPYTTGSLLNFGQICVIPQNTVGIGYIAAYNNANGKIYGYPANSVIPAVKAFATVSLEAGNATANDTVTIGATTYKFVATVSAANDVLIGTDSDETAANLNAAIMLSGTEGTEYGTGTVANASVVSTVEGSIVTLVAKVAGTTGNSIALSKSGTNIAVVGFSGGADATNSLPAGQTLIAGAKFVIVSSNANDVAVLQLGD